MSRVLLLIIAICLLISHTFAVVCNSNQYCPPGWTILRKEDGSATTCDPTDRHKAKCVKPFMCIASKCGLKFCCSNDKMANKLRKEKEDSGDESDNEQIGRKSKTGSEL